MEKHAADVFIFDVKELSSIADYVLICSAESERQTISIAEHIEETLRKKKILPINIEGLSAGRWVLLDYNDVVAHVFLEPVRTLYDLDGLWADAPRITPFPRKRSSS